MMRRYVSSILRCVNKHIQNALSYLVLPVITPCIILYYEPFRAVWIGFLSTFNLLLSLHSESLFLGGTCFCKTKKGKYSPFSVSVDILENINNAFTRIIGNTKSMHISVIACQHPCRIKWQSRWHFSLYNIPAM